MPQPLSNAEGVVGWDFFDQRRINPSAIAAHITAPAIVFNGLAREAGFKTTDQIFPDPKHDKLLQNLLDLPWDRIDIPNPPFPAYRRSLEIPEYQVSLPKHLPPTTALYTPFWFSEVGELATNEIWFHVPEETFYSNMKINKPLPRLSEYLRENDVVNIECRELICNPPTANNVSYQKGISIRQATAGIFEIGSFSVDYPSDQLTGGGVSEGYAYELDGPLLIRRPSPTDCSCGDPDRHEYHLRAMAALDDMLGTTKVDRTGRIIEVKGF